MQKGSHRHGLLTATLVCNDPKSKFLNHKLADKRDKITTAQVDLRGTQGGLRYNSHCPTFNLLPLYWVFCNTINGSCSNSLPFALSISTLGRQHCTNRKAELQLASMKYWVESLALVIKDVTSLTSTFGLWFCFLVMQQSKAIQAMGILLRQTIATQALQRLVALQTLHFISG